jgi:hypothetical protein
LCQIKHSNLYLIYIDNFLGALAANYISTTMTTSVCVTARSSRQIYLIFSHPLSKILVLLKFSYTLCSLPTRRPSTGMIKTRVQANIWEPSILIQLLTLILEI